MAWAQAHLLLSGLGPGQVKRFSLCKMGSVTGTWKWVNVPEVVMMIEQVAPYSL